MHVLISTVELLTATGNCHFLPGARISILGYVVRVIRELGESHCHECFIERPPHGMELAIANVEGIGWKYVQEQDEDDPGPWIMVAKNPFAKMHEGEWEAIWWNQDDPRTHEIGSGFTADDAAVNLMAETADSSFVPDHVEVDWKEVSWADFCTRKPKLYRKAGTVSRDAPTALAPVAGRHRRSVAI